jgi:hypothetical protein
MPLASLNSSDSSHGLSPISSIGVLSMPPSPSNELRALDLASQSQDSRSKNIHQDESGDPQDIQGLKEHKEYFFSDGSVQFLVSSLFSTAL